MIIAHGLENKLSQEEVQKIRKECKLSTRYACEAARRGGGVWAWGSDSESTELRGVSDFRGAALELANAGPYFMYSTQQARTPPRPSQPHVLCAALSTERGWLALSRACGRS